MNKKYFFYKGNLTDLVYLCLMNILLTIVTLGIYYPWARTNMRQYLWKETSFLDEPGEYTGNGKELFIGWLKLLVILFVLGILAEILSKIFGRFIDLKIAAAIGSVASTLIYTYIFALATYAGLRYRMSRTKWKGFAFGVDRNKESAAEFNRLYFKGIFFTVITLGIYYPYFKNRTHKFLVNRTRYGNKYFRYSGDDKEYFKLFAIQSLFVFLTLGLYYPWFFKETLKYRLQHTHIDDAHFDIELNGSEILFFAIGGYLLAAITLGLAAPWILNWGYKLYINKISVDGNFDLSNVQALPSDGSALADEIVTGYDLDFGF